VLEFNGAGASPDRFLFPPHSILEFLSPLTMLASFLVFRKGDLAEERTGIDPGVEYYEPVTIRLDVHERNRDVLDYMRRSVKSADDVRKWMEERMRACKRAPFRFLALRLPHESQIEEGSPVEEVVEVAPKKAKPGPKKKDEKEKEREKEQEKEREKEIEKKRELEAEADLKKATEAGKDGVKPNAPEKAVEATEGVQTRRSGRKKSVRILDGEVIG